MSTAKEALVTLGETAQHLSTADTPAEIKPHAQALTELLRLWDAYHAECPARCHVADTAAKVVKQTLQAMLTPLQMRCTHPGVTRDERDGSWMVRCSFCGKAE